MIECVRAAVARAEGMKVVLADIEVSALESAESKLKAVGAETLAVPTDVSRGKEIEALADARAALEKQWNDPDWNSMMIRMAQLVDNGRIRLCRAGRPIEPEEVA